LDTTSYSGIEVRLVELYACNLLSIFKKKNNFWRRVTISRKDMQPDFSETSHHNSASCPYFIMVMIEKGHEEH
jgi:hypothetical protein